MICFFFPPRQDTCTWSLTEEEVSPLPQRPIIATYYIMNGSFRVLTVTLFIPPPFPISTIRISVGNSTKPSSIYTDNPPPPLILTQQLRSIEQQLQLTEQNLLSCRVEANSWLLIIASPRLGMTLQNDQSDVCAKNVLTTKQQNTHIPNSHLERTKFFSHSSSTIFFKLLTFYQG